MIKEPKKRDRREKRKKHHQMKTGNQKDWINHYYNRVDLVH